MTTKLRVQLKNGSYFFARSFHRNENFDQNFTFMGPEFDAEQYSELFKMVGSFIGHLTASGPVFTSVDVNPIYIDQVRLVSDL